MNSTDTLRGLRVLIAEDNLLIGKLLRTTLEGFGCVVIGPVPDLVGLMAAIDAGGFDAALLDVNLDDAKVFPAASELVSRRVPFLIMTAAGSPASIPAALASGPFLDKPFDVADLKSAMGAAFLPRGDLSRADC